jgi:hypothetical protein
MDSAYDSFDFEYEGLQFKANLYYDDSGIIPFKEFDCYGVVSDWTSRDKAPGERELYSDRGDKRFFDHAATVALFKSWGATGEDADKQAKQAFDRLRGWYNDNWFYCGISIILCDDSGDEIDGEGYQFALWGIESDADGYHREVARELASEVIASYQAGMMGVAA